MENPNRITEVQTPPTPEKKPRTKKRLTSKEQIIRKIDMFTKRKGDKENEIRNLMGQARNYRDAAAQTTDNGSIVKMAQKVERKAEAVGKRVIILDRKLSTLKEKLAEFQTVPIPGFLDDTSVSSV
jgi:hypothetical protein